MNFDPYNCLLKVWKSIKTPTPKVGVHLGVWGFIPSHSPTLLGAWNVTHRFHSWLALLQALALVVNQRLRLRHKWRQEEEMELLRKKETKKRKKCWSAKSSTIGNKVCATFTIIFKMWRRQSTQWKYVIRTYNNSKYIQIRNIYSWVFTQTRKRLEFKCANKTKNFINGLCEH
jgi:hypothetical protein